MIFAHHFNFTFLRYVVLDTDGGWFPFSSTWLPLPIDPVALSLTHQNTQTQHQNTHQNPIQNPFFTLLQIYVSQKCFTLPYFTNTYLII